MSYDHVRRRTSLRIRRRTQCDPVHYTHAGTDFNFLDRSTDLVREENSKRPSDLRCVPDFLFVDVVGWRQRQEDESCRNSDFGEVAHHGTIVEATKYHHAFSQELHLTDQDVGCFGVLGQLLRQPSVWLETTQTSQQIMLRLSACVVC